MKKTIWKRIMQIIGLLVISLLATFSYKGNKSRDMKFTPQLTSQEVGQCPERPNCISSTEETSDEDHYINPLPKYTKEEIKDVIAKYLECQLNTETDNYLHFTCESKVFGFVDDLEFLFVEDRTHIRSASRVGHSDLNKNRQRVMQIIRLLEKEKDELANTLKKLFSKSILLTRLI